MPPDPPACVATVPAEARLATPLDAVGDDLLLAFGGVNILFYAGAVGGSAAMAFSGADSSIQIFAQRHFGSTTYGNAANITGYILPTAVASSVWISGFALGDRSASGAGAAALQALFITAATTFVLKVGIGRAYPGENIEDGHSFRPFQSYAWPFPAWPSGHTSSAFSVVSALTAYYGADEIWIPMVGYPLTLAIGLGMMAGNQHWTSDLLAGAIIGQTIGWSTGRAFRARARGEAAASLSLVPIVGSSFQGIGVSGVW